MAGHGARYRHTQRERGASGRLARAVDRESGWAERLHFGAFLAALLLLAFVAGSVMAFANVFPANHIASAYRGGIAMFDKLTGYDDLYATDLWQKARTGAAGVTAHDPHRAYAGLTLYTSGHAAKAMLVTMSGRVVHEWSRPYSTVWDRSAAVDSPQPDAYTYFRKAHVLPNGDLLAIYIAVGDTPYGYGMVKLDKDSRVIWKYLEHTHHDFDVAPDGRIYLLTHEFGAQALAGFSHLRPPRMDDYLLVLSPDGEELKKVSLLDAIARSPYGALLHVLPWYSLQDPLHTNNVDVIDEATAARLPFASAGQVLLSFREISTIAVLDLDEESIIWAARGTWLGQHDPDFLSNGNLLLFDNAGRFGEGGRSRVIEFDPETMAIRWQYAGTADKPLESIIRSAQQRLPNGNTLITESDGGRIIEVARDGDIVWEFVNPVRAGGSREFIPVVSWAQRLEIDSLESEFRDVLVGASRNRNPEEVS